MRRLLAVLIFVPTVLACATNQLIAPTETPTPSPTPDPCSAELIEQSTASMHEVARQFTDAAELAEMTPRNQLSAQIAPMQDIRRDAEDLDLPDCLSDARDALVDYMEAYIDVLIAFLDVDISDAAMVSGYDQIEAAYDDYADAMDALGVDPGIDAPD
jgi:hypothetical protein